MNKCLIEGRLNTSPIEYESYKVHWGLDNRLDLIFVIAYSKMINLNYVEELMKTMKSVFVSVFENVIINLIKCLNGENVEINPFNDINGLFTGWNMLFDNIHNEINLKYKNNKSNKIKSINSDVNNDDNVVDANEISKNVENLKSKLKKNNNTNNSSNKKNNKKQMRNWNESESEQSLDYSSDKPINNQKKNNIVDNLIDVKSKGNYDNEGKYNLLEYNNEEEQDNLINKALESTNIIDSDSNNSWISYLNPFNNSKTIDEKDLDKLLVKMSNQLMRKNVAREIAENICQSVKQSLIGKKINKFSSINNQITETLNENIKNILTPQSSTNLLLDIKSKLNSIESEPYSIVFCGVNGVGKSTNLSKVCYWLLENRLNVLIAACDTFRSGAVEQLKIHVNNLGNLKLGNGVESKIELYERGYGKDASGIAKDAIKYGKDNKFDVILIDTAGRMQDNEPLMKALAKLLSVNRPDKIIFVGEALVGNEAIDQLVKFDKSLKDLSTTSLIQGRGIDGMLLTKFDTIDDSE